MRISRTSLLSLFMAAAALSAAACGGGSSPSSPSSPSVSSPAPAPSPSPAPTPSPTPTPAPASTVTVAIVGEVGSQAFTPNPVSATVGSAVVFMNNDVTTHHIVLDNGSADFGTVSPGQTTKAVTVSGSGALAFHCTIHPTMVGTINGAAASTSPDPGTDPGTNY